MNYFPLSGALDVIADLPPPSYMPRQNSFMGWVLFVVFWGLFALACLGLRKLFRRRAKKRTPKADDAPAE